MSFKKESLTWVSDSLAQHRDFQRLRCVCRKFYETFRTCSELTRSLVLCQEHPDRVKLLDWILLHQSQLEHLAVYTDDRHLDWLMSLLIQTMNVGHRFRTVSLAAPTGFAVELLAWLPNIVVCKLSYPNPRGLGAYVQG